jgi:hypothetical protein
LFQSRASLGAEILILRHQLNIQRRHLPKRLTFGVMDRLIFVGLSRLAPSTLNALTIVKPETVVRWHRVGFRSYWRWKSQRTGKHSLCFGCRDGWGNFRQWFVSQDLPWKSSRLMAPNRFGSWRCRTARLLGQLERLSPPITKLNFQCYGCKTALSWTAFSPVRFGR